MEGPTALERHAWIEAAIRDGSLVSPCLVYHMGAVDRILALFERHAPGVKLFYSVKANSDPKLLRHLLARGVGFDVASVNELADVLSLGTNVEHVILSNTIKHPKCIREMFNRRVPFTTVDNEQGLRAIATEATFHSFRPGILARIKIKSTDIQVNLNEKFGCVPDEAIRLLALAQELGLPPVGVHFHVGTQCRNVGNYAQGLASAVAVLESLRTHHGIDLRCINIGGGFPDELVAAEVGGIESFFTELGKVLKPIQERGYELFAEPGRVISSGAGTAVSQVIDRNVHEGRHWVYIDDGIYGLFSTAHFEKRSFDLIPLAPTSHERATFVVAGPTCDGLDVIGHQIELPVNIQPGDYVLAHHAGAYSVSVKSHFNGMAQISTLVHDHAVVEMTVQ